MSTNEHAATPQPLDKGYYVATNLSNNLQIAYDSFAIRETEEGIVVESKHNVFGANIPQQTAHFALDRDWVPRRLDVTAEGLMNVVVEFGDAETSLHVKSPQGEQQARFPVGRRRAYFLMSGALYFPLHIVRRFRMNDAAPQTFDLIPSGVCEVRRGEDVFEDGQTLRQLNMRFQIEGLEDVVNMFINERGDLVRYITRNQNLLVKLEERE